MPIDARHKALVDALLKGQATPQEQYDAASRMQFLAKREEELVEDIKKLEVALKGLGQTLR